MRAVYAVDVGSTLAKPGETPNFAWARVEPGEGSPAGSSNICDLASEIERDIKSGRSVALGFEAPLSIPVPESADDLSRRRQGEGNRSWSAQAGALAATLGVHQAAWLLRKLFRSCGSACSFTLDPREWPPTGSHPVLFCWEAFVSGKAKSDSGDESHTRDAATAAMEFLENEHRLPRANAVTAEEPISLIGAVALWAGWAADLQILHDSTTLVIKPDSP